MEPNLEVPLLRILHFNDVYDIEPNKTGDAGAYYFKAHLDQHRNDRTLTLFSGDAFSPSNLSLIFDGEQMVHCLNQLRIDAACYGNHEFDFNIKHTEALAMKCNFPWLLGNLIDKRTKRPLGSAKDEVIIEKNGIKIGLFGVAQSQWLEILTEDYLGELNYVDFVEYSQKKVYELRHVQKCDVVIALSHMRYPSNLTLCQKVPQLDFVLYGHDHNVHFERVNGIQMLNSGTNFQHFSVIDIYPKDSKPANTCHKYSYELELKKVLKTPVFDQSLKDYVDEKLDEYKIKGEEVMGFSTVPLDVRFDKIRTQETNFGNFVVDIIRAFYDCDAAVINSGSVRIHDNVEMGPIKFSLITKMMDSILAVKKVPGPIVMQMLENSCSKYPEHNGRFLLVSGIEYTFDAQLPSGSRVIKESVRIKDSFIDLTKQYTIAMNRYISKGSDGYSCLINCEYAVVMENAIKLVALFKRFLMIAEEQARVSPDITLQTDLRLIKQHISSKDTRMGKYMSGVEEVNGKYLEKITPKKDGRIKILNAVKHP